MSLPGCVLECVPITVPVESSGCAVGAYALHWRLCMHVADLGARIGVRGEGGCNGNVKNGGVSKSSIAVGRVLSNKSEC